MLIIAVVVSAILVEVSSGVSETDSLRSAQNVANWNLVDDYYACLTHQVEGLIPPGRTVWVSGRTPNGALDADTLRKVVVPYAPIRGSRAGLVRLYLVSARHAEGCLGVRVKAVSDDGVVRYGVGTLVSTRHLSGKLG